MRIKMMNQNDIEHLIDSVDEISQDLTKINASLEKINDTLIKFLILAQETQE